MLKSPFFVNLMILLSIGWRYFRTPIKHFCYDVVSTKCSIVTLDKLFVSLNPNHINSIIVANVAVGCLSTYHNKCHEAECYRLVRVKANWWNSTSKLVRCKTLLLTWVAQTLRFKNMLDNNFVSYPERVKISN